MKKVLLIMLLILFITPVYADENKLYFTETDDRLYYKSSLLDEDVFMKHLDMVPGKTFTDELIIENGTNTLYTLYFKVVPRNQSNKANELLENIIMKISIDEKVVYNGKATGLDYSSSGVNLQEAILLGDFTPSKESHMIVETMLSSDYDDTNNNELSYIDWSFYAQYGDSEPTIIVPNTGIDFMSYNHNFMIIVLSLLAIIIGIIVVIYTYKKSNKQ